MKSILVVDDKQSLRQLVREYLEQEGVERVVRTHADPRPKGEDLEAVLDAEWPDLRWPADLYLEGKASGGCVQLYADESGNTGPDLMAGSQLLGITAMVDLGVASSPASISSDNTPATPSVYHCRS